MEDALRELSARWRLAEPVPLGGKHSAVWRVSRGARRFALKRLHPDVALDWRYQLRVGAALRRLGWPTPAPAEDPATRPDGVWLLFDWLPGEPVDVPDEDHRRGRLLAQLHASALETEIDEQRVGFGPPHEIVGDPELEHWLRVHERHRPDEGGTLRRYREAAASWLGDGAYAGVPRSVVHGDFARWNLLYDRGRLTGVLDLDACHHDLQVADFALSWRGHHDDVLRGYETVRPLSDTEWDLVVPTYWAWLFMGVRVALAAHYSRDAGAAPLDLRWQLRHLARRSPLLAERVDHPAYLSWPA